MSATIRVLVADDQRLIRAGFAALVDSADDLEVAVLDRTRTQPRKFARLRPERLETLLGSQAADTPQSSPTPPDDEPPVAPPVS